MSKKACASCGREIDAAARLCVFCGADPATGTKFDSTPVLESEFSRREPLSRRERLLQFVRERQAILVIAILFVIFAAATTLHQMITQRNAAAASDVPSIPLTEIADLSRQSGNHEETPLPDLEFEYEGSSRTIKTLLLEPNAVAPPPPTPPAAAAQPQAVARPGATTP